MNDKMFVKEIVRTGNLNLRKHYAISRKKRLIIPYGKKSERIKKLLHEINELSRKQNVPFEVSIDKDLKEGEVRFKYL